MGLPVTGLLKGFLALALLFVFSRSWYQEAKYKYLSLSKDLNHTRQFKTTLQPLHAHYSSAMVPCDLLFTSTRKYYLLFRRIKYLIKNIPK